MAIRQMFRLTGNIYTVNTELTILLITGLCVIPLPFIWLFVYQTRREKRLEQAYKEIASRAGLSYKAGPQWCPHQLIGQYRGREFLLESRIKLRFQASFLFKFITNTEFDPVWELEAVPVRIKLKVRNPDFVTLTLIRRNWLGVFLSSADTRFDKLFLSSVNPEKFADFILTANIRDTLSALEKPFNIQAESYELIYEQNEALDEVSKAINVFNLVSGIADRIESVQGVQVLEKTK